MIESQKAIDAVLRNACTRFGLSGFTVNQNAVPVEVGIDPQGGLPAIAMYTHHIWRKLGYVLNDLYQIDDDEEGRDDGFPWVLEEDPDALFGQRVEFRENAYIPLSLFLMTLDYSVEHMAVATRLSLSLDNDEPIMVEFSTLIESLVPEEKPNVSLQL